MLNFIIWYLCSTIGTVVSFYAVEDLVIMIIAHIAYLTMPYEDCYYISYSPGMYDFPTRSITGFGRSFFLQLLALIASKTAAIYCVYRIWKYFAWYGEANTDQQNDTDTEKMNKFCWMIILIVLLTLNFTIYPSYFIVFIERYFLFEGFARFGQLIVF